mgnify:CR=1 FL=1
MCPFYYDANETGQSVQCCFWAFRGCDASVNRLSELYTGKRRKYQLADPMVWLKTQNAQMALICVCCVAYLDEANVLGVFTEALTANIQTVLADETLTVSAHAAIDHTRIYIYMYARMYVSVH